ncbi:MAG: anhydro-N-acetylmuramic acid kinase [Alphaproteobacteria bacterium]
MADWRDYTAIGLMSGTSYDGVDAAMLRTDGRRRVAFDAATTTPYSDDLRRSIAAVLGGKGPVDAVARALTDVHADAVRALLAKMAMPPSAVDVIGFHGQTILHAPHERRTWQIGEGQRLADLVGIEVVNDFRTADVLAGGQGAPFVPVFHAVLAEALAKPLAILNIGGVSNVTFIGADFDAGDPAPPRESLLAFDTGPGNALLDDFVRRRTGKNFDRDGALAMAGRPDRSALRRLLANDYFARRPPKSLDRDAFDAAGIESLLTEDGAATLAAFTVESIGLALEHLPARPRRWLVTGGGRHNRAIMAGLALRLAAPVDPVEAVGWNGDALEAQAFGYLAVRSRLGLPLSFPGTTGVPHPMPGGILSRPAVAGPRAGT